jgi:hypothetical protein
MKIQIIHTYKTEEKVIFWLYIHIDAYIYMCMYIHVCVYMYIYINMYIYTYVYYVYVYTYSHIGILNSRASHLLDRPSTTWTTPPRLFVLIIFQKGPPIFWSGWSQKGPTTYASFIAGITDMNHHAELIGWEGISLNFAQTVLEPWFFWSLLLD